jgi:hypothetical protein
MAAGKDAPKFRHHGVHALFKNPPAPSKERARAMSHNESYVVHTEGSGNAGVLIESTQAKDPPGMRQ